jgi:uncharacterized damage-inducible protein DinB
MAGRAGIEAMLYLMDEAFAGVGIEESNESQALLPNLATVPGAAWRELPPGGARSIEAIALHVGASKVMYCDYAFGAAALAWDSPEVQPWPAGEAPSAETIDWLRSVQGKLTSHVAGLADDDELDRLRRTNWGEERPTRWLIAAMITHDAYHAGEINHLRSLLGTDDRWRHEQLGF